MKTQQHRKQVRDESCGKVKCRVNFQNNIQIYLTERCLIHHMKYENVTRLQTN